MAAVRGAHRGIRSAQDTFHQLGGAHPEGPVDVRAADLVATFGESFPPRRDLQVVGVQQGAVHVEDDAAPALVRPPAAGPWPRSARAARTRRSSKSSSWLSALAMSSSSRPRSSRGSVSARSRSVRHPAALPVTPRRSSSSSSRLLSGDRASRRPLGFSRPAFSPIHAGVNLVGAHRDLQRGHEFQQRGAVGRHVHREAPQAVAGLPASVGRRHPPGQFRAAGSPGEMIIEVDAQ